MNEEAKIWVVMPLSLKNSFKDQVFNSDIPFEFITNQCTNDIYLKLLNLTSENYKENDKQIALKKIINSRYKLFTYDAYATYITTQYIDKNLIIKDKVIIIDEAHNIRSTDTKDKAIYSAIKYTVSNGVNNRLILLSATPMYNEPTDMLDLLYLLLLNDKQTELLNSYSSYFGEDYSKIKIDKPLLELIKLLASRYISYLKGKNPFTFAVKLSPKDSGIDIIEDTPKIDPFNKPIPESFKNWIDQIPEGIVPSKIGDIQNNYIKSIKNKKQDDNDSEINANIFNNLQPMNIVFDNEIGEKGFSTFFTSTDDNLLKVKYNQKYENALMPDDQHLGRYSGKFLNICNFVKKSTGIVLIYSRYRYSGIIPLAIALEHMGFSREGTTNILDKPTIISDAPKYDNIKNPKYCILTSEHKEIMGSTTIDKLIKVINDPKNIDGSKIKVILITPVASEGLSFYNTREIHLIEPWYHFNRSVQIIGRGIRNCRHQNLPLEYKNTTVFMHASVEKDNSKETIDLHAFRISTRKFKISNEIDDIINNNSLDCYLMKNINYFPKSLFNLGTVPIKTSQGVTLNYEYGDSELIKPKCNISNKIDDSGFRKETYRHVTGNIITILKNLIINNINNNDYFINYKTLLDVSQIDDKIVIESIRKIIYPNVLLEGYTLIPHEDGIHIIKIQSIYPNKIRILIDKNDKISTQISPEDNLQKGQLSKSALDEEIDYIKGLDMNDMNKACIALYSSLDNNTFLTIVKNILENEILSDRDVYIAECLYLQGALIGKKELKSKNTNKYIGYVNIFNLNDNLDNLDATLYIKETKTYRDCNDNQIEELKRNRLKKIVKPNMVNENMPWGIYYPKKMGKTEIIMNVFKVYTIGEGLGKKTGIECTSLKKEAQKKIFEQLRIPDADGTKIANCNIMINDLLNKGRLTMLPLYKPK